MGFNPVGRIFWLYLMQQGRFSGDQEVALPMRFIDGTGFGTVVAAGRLRGFGWTSGFRTNGVFARGRV